MIKIHDFRNGHSPKIYFHNEQSQNININEISLRVDSDISGVTDIRFIDNGMIAFI